MYTRQPAQPKTSTTELTNPLATAQIFHCRVPQSTIELHVTTPYPIDGRHLRDLLLRIHDFIDGEIRLHGDGPLGSKDGPFVWEPTDPPQALTTELVMSNLPLKLTAESAPGENMTWDMLLHAIEGLFLCLPAAWKNYGLDFVIWDWRDQAYWGFGEVKKMNSVADGNIVETTRTRRNAEDVVL